MPGKILALFAHHFAQPLFDLGVIDIVVIYPALVASVVRRINVDALYLALVPGQQGFQRLQIVTVDHHVFTAVVLDVLSGFVIAVLALQHPVRYFLVVVYHLVFSNPFKCWHRVRPPADLCSFPFYSTTFLQNPQGFPRDCQQQNNGFDFSLFKAEQVLICRPAWHPLI